MPPDWTPNLDASDLEHHHHPTHTPIGSSQELKGFAICPPWTSHVDYHCYDLEGHVFVTPQKGHSSQTRKVGPYWLEMELWHWKYPDKSVTGMIQPMPTNGAMSSPSHTLQNDPCFEWKWPSFGRFKATNRGQTSSRKIYMKKWVPQKGRYFLGWVRDVRRFRQTAQRADEIVAWKYLPFWGTLNRRSILRLLVLQQFLSSAEMPWSPISLCRRTAVSFFHSPFGKHTCACYITKPYSFHHRPVRS